MFQKRPWITLMAFTALGFALTQGILFSRWGMNVGLMAAAGVLLWRAWGGGPRRRGAWWWLLPAACYGAAMALWEQPMLSPLLLLGMVMALGLWALDGIHAGGLWEQARPFFPFGEMEAVASGLRRSARAGRLGRVAMGVGLAVPLLIVAGGLLLSADQAFYNFFEGLTNSLADTLTEVVAKAVLSLLIGVYLCCFYLQAEREKTPALRPQREGDPVVLGVMLGLHSRAVPAVPGDFLPGAAGNASPRRRAGSRTSGAHAPARVFPAARGGGAEPGGVPGGTAPALRGTWLYSRGADPAGGALTLCLIALALTKMLLYIRLYGLTLLRLYTSCMVVALAVLFLALLVSLYRPLPMLRLGAALAACTLAVVGLMNAGSLVAQTNVDRYLAGDLQEMDLTQYTDFPDAAAPALCRLLAQTEDPALREEVLTLFEDALSTREHLFLVVGQSPAQAERGADGPGGGGGGGVILRRQFSRVMARAISLSPVHAGFHGGLSLNALAQHPQHILPHGGVPAGFQHGPETESQGLVRLPARTAPGRARTPARPIDRFRWLAAPGVPMPCSAPAQNEGMRRSRSKPPAPTGWRGDRRFAPGGKHSAGGIHRGRSSWVKASCSMRLQIRSRQPTPWLRVLPRAAGIDHVHLGAQRDKGRLPPGVRPGAGT